MIFFLNKKTNYLFITLFISFSLASFTQEREGLTLDKVIVLAEQKSLDAFKAQNLYQQSDYLYKNFRANRLPTLSLDLEPLTLNRRVEQRFNSSLGRDQFTDIETLNTNIGLSIAQNIFATGGRISLNSSINRFENIGDIENLSFNNTLFNLRLDQEIFGFNRFKWNKKIEPLKYEKARIEFIEKNEDLHITAAERFFNLATAELNLKNIETNLKNSLKLYNIGKERFKIATLNQEELLNLELNVLNSQTELQKAKRRLVDYQFELNIFLGFESNRAISLNVIEEIPLIDIDLAEALEMAKANSSQLLNLKLGALRAEEQLAQAKANRRLSPNLTASIGLNKSGNRLDDTFIDPLNQNRISLKINVPILNWGIAKRNVLIAEHQSKITYMEQDQTEQEFLQKVRDQVIDFNLQKELVTNALKSKEVAVKSNELVLERFKYGNVDIIRLNNSIRAKDKAVNGYINSLKEYWLNYYRLRKITLMDLETGKKISRLFDQKLGLD